MNLKNSPTFAVRQLQPCPWLVVLPYPSSDRRWKYFVENRFDMLNTATKEKTFSCVGGCSQEHEILLASSRDS